MRKPVITESFEDPLELREAIIELYLAIKIRSTEEVSIRHTILAILCLFYSRMLIRVLLQ